MENRHQQILSEIKSLMASVRVQLEQLDVKMAELQQSFEPQSIIIEPTDFSIDDITSVEGLASLPELQTVVEIEPVTAEQPVLADKVASRQAVIDAMASKQAWRTDMPGSPVRDVRAAIALVDRALFINTLFGEDAASFINAVNAVNQMTSLDEAVEYVTENYPDWDMESDIVYRFMMAVRRKVN